MPCTHRCVYCYVESLPYIPREERTIDVRRFESFIARHAELKYPIRFGALSNVCPPYEATARLLGECLRVCERYEYPAMVITKAALHKHLPDVMLRLLDKKLLAVAVTVTTLKRYRELEPHAPSPDERFSLLQWLRDHGCVPILRISPTWQGWEGEVEDILEACPKGHAVFEYARIRRRATLDMLRELGITDWKWDPGMRAYMATKRDERYLKLREVAHRKGFSFAVCGDRGFKVSDYPDCCTGPLGMYVREYVDREEYDREVRDIVLSNVNVMPFRRWRGKDHNLAVE